VASTTWVSAQTLHPLTVRVHQAIVQHDQLSLVPREQHPHRQSHQNRHLLVRAVTQAVERQARTIPRASQLLRQQLLVQLDTVVGLSRELFQPSPHTLGYRQRQSARAISA
jgi:hypothetical protein